MSFLSDFVAYLRSRTDAPPDFHLNGGLVALAACLGSNVWCDGWSRNIYPNIWVVNIAPSGFGKSLALDMSESMVDRAGLNDHKLPSSFSWEGLTKRISQHPNGVWYLQEFASFMSMLDRGYNEGAQQWVTELFDVPEWYTRILSQGEPIVLHKPCISILAASSPAWFAQVYQESALRGGFLARFLFCPSTQTGDYVGHPGPRDDGVEAGLSWHLKKVTELRGRVDLSEVRSRFREWDYNNRQMLRTDCPPEFSGMRSRAGVMVLKAAMLFHVSADPENLVITQRDLSNAIKYVEEAHRKAERYLTEEVANDPKELRRMKVLDILHRRGGSADWSGVLRASKMDSTEFKSAVVTLRDSGIITTPANGRGTLLVLQDRQNGHTKEGEVNGREREANTQAVQGH